MAKRRKQGVALSSRTAATFDWTRLAPLFLIFVGVVVYVNSLTGAFVFDDGKVLRQLEELDGLTEVIPWLFTTRRVMLYFSLAINYAIDGDNVVGYHLVNITVHMIAGLTLFGVVRRTLTGERLRQTYAKSASAIAFCVALIWMVHPLNTQAVTYIVQRGESMMAMFYLLVIYCAIRLIDQPLHLGWFVAAFVCSLLGMLSKEVMITAPIMVILYDWVFIRQPAKQMLKDRGRLYLLLMATWIVYPLLGMGLFVEGKAAGFVYEALTWWQYALSQALVILEYLRLSLWPHPLVFDYMHLAQHTRFEIESDGLALYNITWPVVLILLLVAVSVWGLWRRHPLGFLGAAFFLVLSVTSSVLPIADLMVEHRMYLPLTAVVTLVVIGGNSLIRLLGWRPLGVVLVLFTACTLSVLTIRRNVDYQSSVGLWGTVTQRRPYNPRGWHNLGSAYDESALPDQALACWERVVTITPTYDEAHNNIGKIWLERGDLKRAMTRFQRALELVPDDPEYQYNLGEIHLRRGELDKAITQYRKAIELRPDYAKAYNNLGVATIQQGKLSDAIALFEKAVDLDDEMADAHFNLGKAYVDGGNPTKALIPLQRAVELEPGSLPRQLTLAGTLLHVGRPQEAMAQYRQMLERFPNYPEPLRQLAWVLATYPDDGIRNGAEACALAERASRIAGGRKPRFLKTLAAAYAEVGRSDEAAQIMDRLITRLSAANVDQAMIRSLQQELEVYRNGKPLRVDPVGWAVPTSTSE